jgi:hypothetical protein
MTAAQHRNGCHKVTVFILFDDYTKFSGHAVLLGKLILLRHGDTALIIDPFFQNIKGCGGQRVAKGLHTTFETDNSNRNDGFLRFFRLGGIV